MSGKLELMRTIQEAFDSKAEEIKTGAAMTLGKIALGKLDCFIPFIISEIQNQPKQQYFLLHSLREASPIGSFGDSRVLFNTEPGNLGDGGTQGYRFVNCFCSLFSTLQADRDEKFGFADKFTANF